MKNNREGNQDTGAKRMLPLPICYALYPLVQLFYRGYYIKEDLLRKLRKDCRDNGQYPQGSEGYQLQ